MAPQESIRVTFRRPGDREDASLDLEVSPEQTVGETKRMVQEQDATLTLDELQINGVQVDDSTPLARFVERYEQPLVFTAAERRTFKVSAAPVKRRKRCSFAACTSAPLRGVGDCTNCNGQFCSRHRLMEQHRCEGLSGCRQQLRERNAVKLQEQQTVAHKV